MNESTLNILIGIPGSGKTTWIRKNCKSFYDPYVVCPDNIRKQLDDINNQDNNLAVFYLAKGRMRGALECGHDVILDATNINTKFRRELLKEFKDFRIVAVLFEVDPAVAYDRISRAIFENIERANVPEHVVYRMWGEFVYTKKVIKDESFDAIYNAADYKLNA